MLQQSRGVSREKKASKGGVMLPPSPSLRLVYFISNNQGNTLLNFRVPHKVFLAYPHPLLPPLNKILFIELSRVQ